MSSTFNYMDSNNNIYPKTWRFYGGRRFQPERDAPLFLKSAKQAIQNSVLGTRGFWKSFAQFLLVLGGIIGFLIQTALFVQLYFGYPTTTENSLENSWSMPYPAVTVCNSNPIKKSLWCKVDPDLCSEIEEAVQMRDYETRKIALDKLQEKYKNMTQKMRIHFGHTREDFIIKCKYGEVDCTDLTVQFYDYRYTNCFVINSAWPGSPRQLDTDTTWNPGTNDHTKLELVLDVERSEYVGFVFNPSTRLVVHDPEMVPNPLYEGTVAIPGKEIRYTFRRTIMNLLPKPWVTACQDYSAMREKRTNATMGRENCLDECYFNYTIMDCDCTYHRLALMYDDSKTCPKKKGDWCLQDSYEKRTPVCLGKCNMPCRVAYFDTAAQDIVDFSPETYQDLVNNDNFAKYSFTEAKSNLVTITLAYRKTDHVTFDYKAKYETIAAFSLLGGYVGLWLGVSCATLYGGIEGLYFFFKRLCGYYAEKHARKLLEDNPGQWNAESHVQERKPRISRFTLR